MNDDIPSLTIKELIEKIKYFTDLVRQNAITYEREKELGMPYLQEYNRKRQIKADEVAREFHMKPRKLRPLRWDERHLIKSI